MYLPETIESINEKLERYYGKDMSGKPYFRVSYSEDQFEKRLGTYDDYTENGVFLRSVREVREVPKYRQWVHNKYVLEGLTLIPDINAEELPTQKFSYEPMWVFENAKTGEPLPPLYKACEFILDTVRRQMNPTCKVKYKDTEMAPDEERIRQLEAELFGNETPITDALAYGSGVSLTGTTKEKES